jgi:uncharacterized membrane protein YhaH (DUF805 family)
MNPVDAWKTVVMENYATFDGRAARPEFWWFVVANILIEIVFFVLIAISRIFVVLLVVYALAIIIPSIAVAIRRLHDSDKSGWFLLFGFIPFVGGIILLVFYCLAGTPGQNSYGTAPAS